MKKFIESTLHQNVELKKYNKLTSLPLTVRANYQFYDMELGNQHCLLAKPNGECGLVELRKVQRQVEELTGMRCVLYITRANAYAQSKMLEEGIPFVLENKQVYIPFMGMLIKSNEVRELKPCNRISFLTQKLLLMSLYNGWENATVTTAAEQLMVSKMSITRCFDEIESLRIPVLKVEGRTRLLTNAPNKREQWEAIKPFMRNPVIQAFYLEEDISSGLIKSGVSALAEFSMLGDNSYPTCGVTKAQIREYEVRNKRQVPNGEKPGCVIHELGYAIPFRKGTVIDPLTTMLIMEDERRDPRVDKAIDEMLERYVW